MKFAAFAFVAGLCLVAVTANVVVDFPQIDGNDMEYIANDFADDLVEIETFGAFSGMYWLLKKVLRTLKGINCAIQGALNMKNAAQQFIDDVQACGGQVSQQVQDVINSCTAVIGTVNNIVNLNDNVCNNGDYNDQTDGSTKTSWSCFWKLLKQFMTLKKQIQNALSLIQKVPTIGTGANECVNTALTELTNTFTGFPAFVVSCSKLTSN